MQRIEIGSVLLEKLEEGRGPPLLFLHGGEYFPHNGRFIDALARNFRVLAPRHPGFGGSPRPEGFRTIHDLAYLYLELIDREDLDALTLVGVSFGGWIALEIAVRSTARVGRIALIDTLGVKFGGREERDIADIYALPETELRRRLFQDPGRFAPDYRTLSEEEMAAVVRDREALALYGWRPYMHDPGLRQWLHRVRVPTLVLWGENDGIVDAHFGETLSRALPRARFEVIAGAGHYPQIERPTEVAKAIADFGAAGKGDMR